MTQLSRSSRALRVARSKLWLAVMLATCLPYEAYAGIVTDGSVGAITSLSGSMTIPQTLGRISGNNLFHSFQTFNILTGESANFTTTTTSIANVISRVTGGSLSQINGALSLTPCVGCGAPNFFFINPAGVTFGAGASVNVPGAFHVSTADYVKFPDGNYYADLSKASTFSSAPPEAFGFLGNSRASITVNGVAILNNNNQSISIVAGDVTLDSGIVSTQEGGDIRVVALGQDVQEVPFTGALPAAHGDLNILNGGYVMANALTSATAGSVTVSAGNINVDGHGDGTLGISSNTGWDSLELFSTGNTGNAGSVTVNATGHISLINAGVINADTYSNGNAGNATVNAGSITVDETPANTYFTSRISSAANVYGLGYTGNSGAVQVTTTGYLSLINGGVVLADNLASGNAGSVTVHAGDITIDGQGSSAFTGISSNVWGATGTGGAINVTSNGNLTIANGGGISSATVGSGDSGSINISAGNISIDGKGNSTITTGITTVTYSDAGKAGAITVTASGSLSLINASQISTSTETSGNAGSVTVNAGSISIDGQGTPTSIGSTTYYSTGNAGAVSVTSAGSLFVINAGEITSGTYGSGNAGSVNINAGNITVNNANINSVAYPGSLGDTGTVNVISAENLSIINSGYISSTTFGSGNANTVNIQAGNITIDGNNTTAFTGIGSDSDLGGTGKAGNAGIVNVTTAGTLSLVKTGQISSNTFTSGSAGSVNVSAGRLLIDGAANGYNSGVFARARIGSAGQTGNLTVTANDITLSNGGEISIQNDATVINPAVLTPTSINVTAPRITILNSPNAITASSTGNIDAGSITINASDTLTLDPSGITTTSVLGNGGNIDVTAGKVWLDNSLITTSAGGSIGGNITINADSLILNTGFIQANAPALGATGGTITIAAQNLLPSGNTLFLGGNTPYAYQPGIFGFNVIQAAAPTGVSGTVTTTSPTLDLSSSLSGLNIQQIDTGGLGRSPCQTSGGSSLAPSGRGGLTRGLLRAELPIAPTLTGYTSPAPRGELRLALSDWSCS